MRLIRRFLVLALVIVPGVVLIPYAQAIPPERTTQEVDDTFLIPAELCGFPIQGHVTGVVRETVFFDQEGNPVRILTTRARVRFTFTNLDTGTSITTVSSVTRHITINPDGSEIWTFTGLGGHIFIQGEGHVAADIGRWVLFFEGPGDTDPELIFQAGQFNDGPFPQLCDVLGA